VDTARADISVAAAAAAGLGTIALVLVIYEALIRSPLANQGKLFGLVLYGILVVSAWALFQVLSGRGAFIHVGAIIGTIMVANVFLGIIPAQKALVAAVRDSRAPDGRVARLATLAKLRSTHNNYLTLPVLFIMISNHYPMLYGHPMGWAILAAIGFIAAFTRHYFNLRHRDIDRPSILVVAALLATALIWTLAPRTPEPMAENGAMSAAPTDTQVLGIVNQHCLSCHARVPAHPAFQAAPAGIVLDSLAALSEHGARVRQAAVDTHYMPLGNTSGMTEEERRILGQWLLTPSQ